MSAPSLCGGFIVVVPPTIAIEEPAAFLAQFGTVFQRTTHMHRKRSLLAHFRPLWGSDVQMWEMRILRDCTQRLKWVLPFFNRLQNDLVVCADCRRALHLRAAVVSDFR